MNSDLSTAHVWCDELEVCEENSDHDVDDNDSNGDDNDADNNDDDKIIIARNRQIIHMCFKLLISGEIGCITT